ncbi:MAG: DMT family transporter [Pseudomonadota bacterium]
MNVKSARTRNLIAWVSMLLIGTLWGGTIPLSKISVSTGHQPFGLIFWQLVIGVILLGLVLLFRGWRPRLNRELLFYFLVIAVCGTLLPNGTSYLAQQHLPAGVMAIAIATVPMFAFALALSVRLERFDIRRMFGILVAFFAMLLIAAPETSLPDSSKAVFVLVALVAPFFYGIEANYIATHKPEGVDPVSTLFMASLLGMTIALPVSLSTGQWIDPFQPWGAAEWSLIAASIIHAITYCAFIWLVGFGGPVFSVQTAYPVTLSGVFLSIVFLGEGYSGWIWTALVLVIIGLALVQPKLEDLQTEEANA